MAKAKPVLFYDVGQDEIRPITQEDVDKLQRIANAYGSLSGSVARALDATAQILTGVYNRPC